MPTLAFITNLGTWDGLILVALGLLLFGRRLPEVGRSLGRGIVEFKKGLKGEDDDDRPSDRGGSASAGGSAGQLRDRPQSGQDNKQGPGDGAVRIVRAEVVEHETTVGV